MTFRWERWRQTDPEWDHDHCFFCQVCICDSRTKGHYGEAFVVRHQGDPPFWVCRSRFKLVRRVLEWHVDQAKP